MFIVMVIMTQEFFYFPSSVSLQAEGFFMRIANGRMRTVRKQGTSFAGGLEFRLCESSNLFVTSLFFLHRTAVGGAVFCANICVNL